MLLQHAALLQHVRGPGKHVQSDEGLGLTGRHACDHCTILVYSTSDVFEGLLCLLAVLGCPAVPVRGCQSIAVASIKVAAL